MAMQRCTRTIATFTLLLAVCAPEPAVWSQGGQAQSQRAVRGCDLPEPFRARLLESWS